MKFDSEDIKDFFVSFILGLVIVIATIEIQLLIINFLSSKIIVKNSKKENKRKWQNASKVFNVKIKKLKKMKKEELKTLYRKLAQKHHPDKGGNSKDFRNLHEAYEFVYAQ